MANPNLHDATLLSIHLTWGKKSMAEVEFRDSGPRLVKLLCDEVKNLQCPHANPWGPSVSVNEIRGPNVLKDKSQRIEIEVQSGDVIAIEAMKFEWKVSEPVGG